MKKMIINCLKTKMFLITLLNLQIFRMMLKIKILKNFLKMY